MTLNPLNKKFKELDNQQSRDNANHRFNIRRVDGVDYIMYDNIRISVEGDTDLVERLAKLREYYLNDFLK